MIISHQKKFIFVHIPKSAGTSVSMALLSYADGQSRQKKGTKHEDLQSFLTRQSDTDFSGYFKFAFVRNAWDRMVSLFHYMRMYPDEAPPEVRKLRDFHHFIAEIEAGAPWTKDRHSLRPQADFVTDGSGKLIIDCIGRFETFMSDLEKSILPRLSLTLDDLQIPHERSSGGASRFHYSEFYNDKSRDVVARLYAQDIELFDFRFAKASESART